MAKWISGTRLVGEAHSDGTKHRTFDSWPVAYQHFLETIVADRFDASDSGDEAVVGQLDGIEDYCEAHLIEGQYFKAAAGEWEYFIEPAPVSLAEAEARLLAPDEPKPDAPCYLVVWSLYIHVDRDRNDDVTDHWVMIPDRAGAMAKYAELLDHPQLHSAHVVVPVESTDYDTVEG